MGRESHEAFLQKGLCSDAFMRRGSKKLISGVNERGIAKTRWFPSRVSLEHIAGVHDASRLDVRIFGDERMLAASDWHVSVYRGKYSKSTIMLLVPQRRSTSKGGPPPILSHSGPHPPCEGTGNLLPKRPFHQLTWKKCTDPFL